MNISITFRHMDASAAIKGYAREKVAKLQKFMRQPMTAKVTLSLDKLKRVAEARVSSGGEHIEAREDSDDMYASIDKMIDKLERIIRGTKEAKVSKARRSGATLRGAAAAGSSETAEAEQAEPAMPKKTRTATRTPTRKVARKVSATPRVTKATRGTTRKAAKR